MKHRTCVSRRFFGHVWKSKSLDQDRFWIVVECRIFFLCWEIQVCSCNSKSSGCKTKVNLYVSLTLRWTVSGKSFNCFSSGFNSSCVVDFDCDNCGSRIDFRFCVRAVRWSRELNFRGAHKKCTDLYRARSRLSCLVWWIVSICHYLHWVRFARINVQKKKNELNTQGSLHEIHNSRYK